MSKILVVYGTTEGQAARVADRIAEVLRDRGHDVTVLDVRNTDDTVLAAYDAVVVGASIHMGKHASRMVDFIRTHRDTLARMPAAFFSVSLAALDDTAEARKYVEQLEQETGWKPEAVSLVAGALPYTHYGFIKRRMMRRIVASKSAALSTDTSRDHVYTDWSEVAHFATGFAQAVESSKAAGAT
ncbi:MAG TPA: flavodoxin domain-containing protein [Marmoricola sp.]|nr:flavodoxin domain-containing protein [Marmoricola sp.]